MEKDDSQEDVQEETAQAPEQEPGQAQAKGELAELNDKYLRLYANFENYKKRVNKDKEDLVKFGNEKLLYELLPAVDNLELALRHAGGSDSGLVQGVEMTLKEFWRTLEKFGLVRIEAAGKPFDPAVHHAMAQVERDDLDDKTIAEEFRAGYFFHGKVLRPSLVSVSVRQKAAGKTAADNNNTESDNDRYEIEEEE